jgi:hypothetical protein
VQQWLEHPAVQAGVLPFLAALVAGLALRRARAVWLAPTLAYAVAVALTSGIAFSPLTAGRKVLLLSLLAPLAGAAVDRLDARGARGARVVACVLAGLAAAWAVSTVLAQRPAGEAVAIGLGLAAFAAAAVALVMWRRDDDVAIAASGLGLGLATGVGALLSASTGYFAAGVALAAGSGALLALRFAAGPLARPGATGALAVALPAALFASATLMLAQLPWTALPALLLVPVLAGVPLPPGLGARARVIARTLLALAAAALPVLVAWIAARSASA